MKSSAGASPSQLQPLDSSSGLLVGGEHPADVGGDFFGAAGLGIDGAPDGSCLGEEFAVGSEDFGVAVEAEALGLADPGFEDDEVPCPGGGLIVDLVAKDHPDDFLLHVGSGQGFPVSDGGLLDPADVDSVVDVAEGVNVVRNGEDAEFVGQAEIEWVHALYCTGEVRLAGMIRESGVQHMGDMQHRRDEPDGSSSSLRIWLSLSAIGVAVAAMLYTIWELGGFDKIQSLDHAWVIGANLAPYGALILVSMVASRRLLSAGIGLLGTVLTSGLGVYSLLNAFHWNPDAQGGIVALVLPMIQWICCGLTVGAILFVLFVKWVVWPERSRTENSPPRREGAPRSPEKL